MGFSTPLLFDNLAYIKCKLPERSSDGDYIKH